MKTVFDNSMVAHIWAAQSQPEGRSGNGNFYFRGPRLYSYGPHFTVGIVRDGMAFLNGDSYSISTSRHCSEAWSATRHLIQVRVPGLGAIGDSLLRPGPERAAIVQHVKRYVTDESAALILLKLAGEKDPSATFRRLVRERDRAAAKQKAAEKKADRNSRLDYATRVSRTPRSEWPRWLDGLDSYNLPRAAKSLFHAHRAAKSAGRVRQSADVWSLLRLVRERIAAREKADRVRERNRFTKTECRAIRGALATLSDGNLNRAYDFQRLADSARWVAENARALGGLKRESFAALQVAALARRDVISTAENAERFAKEKADRESWLAGGGRRYWHFYDANGGAMLRAVNVQRDESGEITGGDLQTSMGAAVPLVHAIRAFRFLKACKESGTGWTSNGRTVRVGHFQIDAIEPSGNFRAGCHTINWTETERLAMALGVFDSSVPA